MKFTLNNFFKPRQFKELAEKLVSLGHGPEGRFILARSALPSGQHARLDPAEAFRFSRLSGVEIKQDHMPASLKVLGKVQNAYESSGLMDAFEVMAKDQFPDLNLDRDHGWGYRYKETSDRFRIFVAGSFCIPLKSH